MKQRFRAILLLVLTGFILSDLYAQDQMISHSRFRQKIRINYLVWKPSAYHEKKSERFPLLIFLHGSGERGTDLNLVKKWGPPSMVETRKDLPFIVISPQCPENQWWSIDQLDHWLDKLLKKYRIDPDRVYLTGLSMGGFATWEWACAKPERFAAIAPVCGGGNVLLADNLRQVPIWAFHGEDDPVVPVSGTKDMVNAALKEGAPARMTLYPQTGHDSWIQAYSDEELYKWFLLQSRKYQTGKN